jgi:hypothetical protein
MRLALAIATLVLATSTALPAFAAAPTGHYFYSHPQGYSRGYDAYAAAPRARHPVARRQAPTSWGHCVTGEQGLRSAYPGWDVC